jgi:hypothetical protein
MHKTFPQLVCASLITLACLGTVLAQNAAENLLPVQQNEKWGYINRSGEIIIKPQFDSAELFADGLALVRANTFGNRAIDALGGSKVLAF